MEEKEVVLQIGVEGGGETVYRTAVAGGGWQFHVEGCSMFMDENDVDNWRTWTEPPVASFHEMLQSMAKAGTLLFFHPSAVHPEYRQEVWAVVQEIAHHRPARQRERLQDWRRICLEME